MVNMFGGLRRVCSLIGKRNIYKSGWPGTAEVASTNVGVDTARERTLTILRLGLDLIGRHGSVLLRHGRVFVVFPFSAYPNTLAWAERIALTDMVLC